MANQEIIEKIMKANIFHNSFIESDFRINSLKDLLTEQQQIELAEVIEKVL